MQYKLAKCNDQMDVWILENSVRKLIITHIFINNQRKSMVAKYLLILKRVGNNKELVQMQDKQKWHNVAQGAGSSFQGNSVQTYGRQGEAMDMDAVHTKKDKCFNCSSPHLVKDCNKSRKACKKCNFFGGRHQ